MTFWNEFTDMLADTFTVIPGATDAFGEFVPSGAVLVLPCRIEGQARLTRALNGNETVSSVQVICEAHNLSVERHRYTLPTRFDPHDSLRAISIEKMTDETEPVYECVMLP